MRALRGIRAVVLLLGAALAPAVLASPGMVCVGPDRAVVTPEEISAGVPEWYCDFTSDSDVDVSMSSDNAAFVSDAANDTVSAEVTQRISFRVAPSVANGTVPQILAVVFSATMDGNLMGQMQSTVYVMPDVSLTSLETGNGSFTACTLVQSSLQAFEGRIDLQGGETAVASYFAGVSWTVPSGMTAVQGAPTERRMTISASDFALYSTAFPVAATVTLRLPDGTTGTTQRMCMVTVNRGPQGVLAAIFLTPVGGGADTLQWTARVAYQATITGWTHPLGATMLYSVWGYWASAPQTLFRLTLDSTSTVQSFIMPPGGSFTDLVLVVRATDTFGYPAVQCVSCARKGVLLNPTVDVTISPPSTGDSLDSILRSLVVMVSLSTIPETSLAAFASGVAAWVTSTNAAQFVSQTARTWAAHLRHRGNVTSYDMQVVSLYQSVVASTPLSLSVLDGVGEVYGAVLRRLAQPGSQMSSQSTQAWEFYPEASVMSSAGSLIPNRRLWTPDNLFEPKFAPTEATDDGMVLRQAVMDMLERTATFTPLRQVACTSSDPPLTPADRLCFAACVVTAYKTELINQTSWLTLLQPNAPGDDGRSVLRWVAANPNWLAAFSSTAQSPVTVASVQLAEGCNALAKTQQMQGPMWRVEVSAASATASTQSTGSNTSVLYPLSGASQGCTLYQDGSSTVQRVSTGTQDGYCSSPDLTSWVAVTGSSSDSSGGSSFPWQWIVVAEGILLALILLALLVWWLRRRHLRRAAAKAVTAADEAAVADVLAAPIPMPWYEQDIANKEAEVPESARSEAEDAASGAVPVVYAAQMSAVDAPSLRRFEAPTLQRAADAEASPDAQDKRRIVVPTEEEAVCRAPPSIWGSGYIPSVFSPHSVPTPQLPPTPLGWMNRHARAMMHSLMSFSPKGPAPRPAGTQRAHAGAATPTHADMMSAFRADPTAVTLMDLAPVRRAAADVANDGSAAPQTVDSDSPQFPLTNPGRLVLQENPLQQSLELNTSPREFAWTSRAPGSFADAGTARQSVEILSPGSRSDGRPPLFCSPAHAMHRAHAAAVGTAEVGATRQPVEVLSPGSRPDGRPPLFFPALRVVLAAPGMQEVGVSRQPVEELSPGRRSDGALPVAFAAAAPCRALVRARAASASSASRQPVELLSLGGRPDPLEGDVIALDSVFAHDRQPKSRDGGRGGEASTLSPVRHQSLPDPMLLDSVVNPLAPRSFSPLRTLTSARSSPTRGNAVQAAGAEHEELVSVSSFTATVPDSRVASPDVEPRSTFQSPKAAMDRSQSTSPVEFLRVGSTRRHLQRPPAISVSPEHSPLRRREDGRAQPEPSPFTGIPVLGPGTPMPQHAPSLERPPLEAILARRNTSSSVVVPSYAAEAPPAESSGVDRPRHVAVHRTRVLSDAEATPKDGLPEPVVPIAQRPQPPTPVAFMSPLNSRMGRHLDAERLDFSPNRFGLAQVHLMSPNWRPRTPREALLMDASPHGPRPQLPATTLPPAAKSEHRPNSLPSPQMMSVVAPWLPDETLLLDSSPKASAFRDIAAAQGATGTRSEPEAVPVGPAKPANSDQQSSALPSALVMSAVAPWLADETLILDNAPAGPATQRPSTHAAAPSPLPGPNAKADGHSSPLPSALVMSAVAPWVADETLILDDAPTAPALRGALAVQSATSLRPAVPVAAVSAKPDQQSSALPSVHMLSAVAPWVADETLLLDSSPKASVLRDTAVAQTAMLETAAARESAAKPAERPSALPSVHMMSAVAPWVADETLLLDSSPKASALPDFTAAQTEALAKATDHKSALAAGQRSPLGLFPASSTPAAAKSDSRSSTLPSVHMMSALAPWVADETLLMDASPRASASPDAAAALAKWRPTPALLQGGQADGQRVTLPAAPSEAFQAPHTPPPGENEHRP